MAADDLTTEVPTLIERITRYLALCDNPEFVECPTCKGKGYHHGFGETGRDPDWCSDCGGPGQYPHPDWDVSPDDLLREAFAELGRITAHLKSHPLSGWPERPRMLSEGVAMLITELRLKK
jgi:hypothetical protein